MKQASINSTKLFVFLLFAFGISIQVNAQGALDFGRDTISRADALGGRSTYVNTIKGSGQSNATERINLQVNKLKAIMDACAANNITEVSVMIVTIRQTDIARYRRLNPGSTATDNQLRGSQLLVFKVPRRAFQGAMGAGIRLNQHPGITSLAHLGLYLMESGFGLPEGSDDIYFGMGAICPPPTSCD